MLLKHLLLLGCFSLVLACNPQNTKPCVCRIRTTTRKPKLNSKGQLIIHQLAMSEYEVCKDLALRYADMDINGSCDLLLDALIEEHEQHSRQKREVVRAEITPTRTTPTTGSSTAIFKKFIVSTIKPYTVIPSITGERISAYTTVKKSPVINIPVVKQPKAIIHQSGRRNIISGSSRFVLKPNSTIDLSRIAMTYLLNDNASLVTLRTTVGNYPSIHSFLTMLLESANVDIVSVFLEYIYNNYLDESVDLLMRKPGVTKLLYTKVINYHTIHEIIANTHFKVVLEHVTEADIDHLLTGNLKTTVLDHLFNALVIKHPGYLANYLFKGNLTNLKTILNNRSQLATVRDKFN